MNYQAELEQVNLLLEAESGNPQFLKLKSDLENIIELTSSNSSHNGGTNTNQVASIHTETYSSDSSAVNISIGQRVLVVSGDRPFAGVVTGISAGNMEASVKYYEYENTVTLPLTSLRPMPRGTYHAADNSSSAVQIGLKCQVKYGLDQRWYDAEVIGITEFGYDVSYREYGNREEVPLEYIRPVLSAKEKGTANGGEKLLTIPENLKILPTDTEEDKLKKKKKIKAIKSKNRVTKLDAEVGQVQATWKSFQAKSEKKDLSGIVKNSMFSSPDVVEGRVGVTNSGHGLTDYEKRKRHKFNDV